MGLFLSFTWCDRGTCYDSMPEYTLFVSGKLPNFSEMHTLYFIIFISLLVQVRSTEPLIPQGRGMRGITCIPSHPHFWGIFVSGLERIGQKE